MNFGKLQKKIEINKKFYIKLYFTIGTIIIVSLFVLYSEVFRRQATKEARIVPDLVSNFMYYSGHENFENILMHYILKDIVANISYPIIISDVSHIPVFWKNIGVNESTHWDDLTLAEQSVITKRLDKMRKKDYYLPLYNAEQSYVFGFTYFEDTNTIKRLKLIPYIEAIVVIVFMTFGMYGIILLKRYEKRMIWVGFAKETAHQFGTPISALIGWVDFFKSKIENNTPHKELAPLLDELITDIQILKKIASRFGKVGSRIELRMENIDKVINNCIIYFQKRLPRINNQITLEYINKNPETILMLDKDLMQWAIENILKNCIDAMINRCGKISITSFIHEKKYVIIIKDQGRGINKSMLERIFEPGVTSKNRGWGLGLSLAKRIIEDYHNGKIKVLDSMIDEGTSFEINIHC